MNILVLTSEYPSEKYPKPDWTWVVPYFCREWVKQGHRVVVVNNTSRFPKVYYEIAKYMRKQIANYFDVSEKGLEETKWRKRFTFSDFGVKVYNLPMKKMIPGGEFSRREFRQQIKKISNILEKEDFKPNVITGHWLNPQLRLVCGLGKIYKDIKTAIVFHGDYGKEICRKHKAHEYIDGIDAVGCRSKAACNEIKMYLPIKNCFVCASGIPDEYITKDRLDKKFHSERLHVFSAGRLVKYKNFGTIIGACAKSLQDYQLLIAGDGPLRNKLIEQIRAEKQHEKVKLIGKIDRELVQQYMVDADVFILISNTETFGLVYLEAMIHGCMVIASYGGGMDGIIKDGENGFLCEQGNEEKLGEILKNIILLNEKEKYRISKNAIETAREYTNSKAARRYLENITGGYGSDEMEVKGFKI